MDTATVLEIIKAVENAYNNTPANEDFECETTREHQAYVKGQRDALESTLGHLQSFIEGQLNNAENSTGE